MDLLSVAGVAARGTVDLAAEAGAVAEPGFQINLFWILAQAFSLLLFFAILYLVAFRRIGGVLAVVVGILAIFLGAPAPTTGA